MLFILSHLWSGKKCISYTHAEMGSVRDGVVVIAGGRGNQQRDKKDNRGDHRVADLLSAVRRGEVQTMLKMVCTSPSRLLLSEESNDIEQVQDQ